MLLGGHLLDYLHELFCRSLETFLEYEVFQDIPANLKIRIVFDGKPFKTFKWFDKAHHERL
jgi:hypothetical protein